MSGDVDPFRGYHRARLRMTLARVTAIVATSTALAVGLGLLAGAAPAPSQFAVADSAAVPAQTYSPADEPPLTQPTAVAPAETPPATLPEPVVAAPAPQPLPLPVTGSSSWLIEIDTTGYQAEIDQCLWVRMNLGAAAPIVGVHNYCGGGDVLEMALGDTVVLTGTGLDGSYVVTDSRDARAGDNAARATAGMVASVILQTCYWINDGSERLVGLTSVG